MKNSKPAFTLAELLLCVGIIGIVSAMGMTIAKHGTDKAYNLFYYSAYINLYNAIADAKASGSEVSNRQIMEHVSDLLSPDNVEGPVGGEAEEPPAAGAWPGPDDPNSVHINALNGVDYYYSNNLTEGLNGIAAINGVTNAIPITMTIPQRKTRENSGIAVVHLVYVDADNGYLIPVAEGSTVDLQRRRDLLPAYIDDGKVGRNQAINRDNFEYQRIVYASYRDAFCTVRNAVSLGNLVNCTGYTSVAPREGVLKVADPRKAR